MTIRFPMGVGMPAPSMLHARESHNNDARVSKQPTIPAAEKLSAQAGLGEALKKSAEAARAFGDALQTQVDTARQDAARERIEQTRERIRMLKMIVLLFGGKASKGLLKQIQQMARELNQAASILKESGGSPADSAGATAGFLYTEAGAVSAEDGSRETAPPIAQSEAVTQEQDAQATATQLKGELASLVAGTREERTDMPEQARKDFVAAASRSNSENAQRNADADLIDKALRELKALLAMAKALRNKERDEESDKQIREIQELLAKTERHAKALIGGSASVVGSISISV